MTIRDITNAEGIEMMNRCANEITHLKNYIDLLQPKADAYDNIATILRLLPQPSQGMSEDLVWLLRNRVKELTPPASRTGDVCDSDER